MTGVQTCALPILGNSLSFTQAKREYPFYSGGGGARVSDNWCITIGFGGLGLVFMNKCLGWVRVSLHE